MGPDLRKFLKKTCQISRFFEVTKILRYEQGFQTSGRTLYQKIIWVPPQLIVQQKYNDKVESNC